MRLYVDLDTLQLVQGPGNNTPVTSIRVKRGTSPRLELQFLRNGEPEPVLFGSVIRLMLKEQGKYDGPSVVFTDDFIAPGETDGFYIGRASFNTTAVNALLGSPDGVTTNDKESAELMAEFTWSVPGDDPEKTETFTIVVGNAVDNGDEAAPTEAGPNLNTRLAGVEAAIEAHNLLLDGTNSAPAFKADQITVFAQTLAGDFRSYSEGSDTIFRIQSNSFSFSGTLLSIETVMGQVFSVDYNGAIMVAGSGVEATRNNLGAVGGVWPVSLGGTGKSARPTFIAQGGTVGQSLTGGVFSKVRFDTEVYDSDGCFTPWDGTTNSSRFTPNQPGVYQFNATANFNGITLGVRVIVTLYKNGVEVARFFDGLSGGSGNLAGSGAALYEANGTSDYFEVYVFHDGGTVALEGGLFTMVSATLIL